MKKIAIIGSRRMTPYGKRVVEWLINKLAKNELVIISGMTGGVNREVARMARINNIKIEVITSENGIEWMNLEIAKKADVLVVVEGGKNSGTILVAKNFLDLNKEVFAVPGRIDDENSWAPNWLISQGASLLGKSDYFEL